MSETVKKTRKKKVVEPVVEPIVPVTEPQILTEDDYELLVEWFVEFTATVVVINMPAKVWLENNDVQVQCREEDVATVNNLLGVSKQIAAARRNLMFQLAENPDAKYTGFEVQPTYSDRTAYRNVTKNGEITVDDQGEFTVWDETFSNEVFKTKDITLAFQRLSEFSAFLKTGYGKEPEIVVDAVQDDVVV